MEALIVFVFWILLACIVGGYANNRGRSGIFWIIFSLILSPLLGFLFVAVSPNIAEVQRLKTEKRSREIRVPISRHPLRRNRSHTRTNRTMS